VTAETETDLQTHSAKNCNEPVAALELIGSLGLYQEARQKVRSKRSVAADCAADIELDSTESTS